MSFTKPHLLGTRTIPVQRRSLPDRPARANGPAPSPRGSSASLRLVPLTVVGVDTLLVSLAVVAAVLWRELLPFTEPDTTLAQRLAFIGPAIVLVWLAVMFLTGAYRDRIFGAGVDEFKRVVSASTVTAALVGILCYLAKFDLSRGFFVLTFVLGTPMLLLGRLLLRRSLHRAYRQGLLAHRVVIAGSAGHVDEIATVLRRESWLGYDVVGALLPGAHQRDETYLGIPVLASAQGVATAAVEAGADVVFLAGGAFDSADGLRQLAWELEDQAVQVVIAPSVTDVASERIRVRPVGGLPLIHLEKPRSQAATRGAKRAFDIVGALLLIVAFAPLLALSALWVRTHDRGPALFRQSRVGRDGVAFDVLKFRTMVPDAESLLERVHREQGYEGGLFKMADDPRITPPGRWLRRFSVDEVPQLFNVLKGDMSLVGPRPPLRHEVSQYSEGVARRLRVRPGMTGLWQVSGRSDLSWDEAIRLDLYYVDNWSMIQDLSILARTLSAVLGSRGAY